MPACDAGKCHTSICRTLTTTMTWRCVLHLLRLMSTLPELDPLEQWRRASPASWGVTVSRF